MLVEHFGSLFFHHSHLFVANRKNNAWPFLFESSELNISTVSHQSSALNNEIHT